MFDWVPYGYVMEEDGTVRPATGWEEAVEWERNPERAQVAFTEFDGGRVQVSTVFLRIAPGYSFHTRKRLHFETMIFLSGEADRRWQYETRDEAVIGHDAACALVLAELNGGTPS